MAKHRDQAKFERSGWKLRVLLPCWVAQISLLLVLIGTSAYLLSNAMKDEVEVRATAITWAGMNIGISVISVLLTAYEIFRTLQEALTPKTLLVCSLLKLGGVVLSMIMDGIVTGSALNAWADGTFVIHSLLIASLLTAGSYAAWKWKRLAQYDDYHLPGNVNTYGFKSDLKNRGFNSRSAILSEDLDWLAEVETGYNVEVSDNASPGLMGLSPGETTPTRTTGQRESGSSFTNLGGRKIYSMITDTSANDEIPDGSHSRSNSASTLAALDTAYDPAANTEVALPQRPASYISVTGAGASYNHSRDTSFDQYVAQQQQQKKKRRASSQRMSAAGSRLSWTSTTSSSSNSSSGNNRHSLPPASPPAARPNSMAAYRLSLNLKSDIDDALGAEFGWGSHSRSSSQDSAMAGGQPPAIAVGGGPVQSAKNVRDSIGRAPSDGSERGALGIVPEAAEDNDGDEHDRARKVDEASRALLGESSVSERDHPDLLRPGRPKSEAIAFVVTPPPRSPSPGGNRMTWGAAYARNS